MSNVDRKALVREYRERKAIAGIYRVRNLQSGKSLVGSAADVPAMLNRHQAQLKFGSSPDKELQADWRALGADAFAFETMDELPPREPPAGKIEDDLRVLKSLWLEKLLADGVPLYPHTHRQP